MMPARVASAKVAANRSRSGAGLPQRIGVSSLVPDADR